MYRVEGLMVTKSALYMDSIGITSGQLGKKDAQKGVFFLQPEVGLLYYFFGKCKDVSENVARSKNSYNYRIVESIELLDEMKNARTVARRRFKTVEANTCSK